MIGEKLCQTNFKNVTTNVHKEEPVDTVYIDFQITIEKVQGLGIMQICNI